MTEHLEGYVEVPGGRLWYEVDGPGDKPALTLVHAGVADLRMWDDQVPLFAARYRVIRYDTRGFGRTESEAVEFSNREDLRAVLRECGVERTHLLGCSRGGSIAIDTTLESPEVVTSLLAVAAGYSGWNGEPTPAEVESFQEADRLWDAGDREGLLRLETRLWGDGPGQPEGRMPAGPRSRLEEMNRTNFFPERPEPRPIPLDPPAASRLEEIRVPTLVMWGDLDTDGTQRMGAEMAARVDGARSVVFEGVAHMVNLEEPERFTEEVLAFLDEVETVAHGIAG